MTEICTKFYRAKKDINTIKSQGKCFTENAMPNLCHLDLSEVFKIISKTIMNSINICG